MSDSKGVNSRMTRADLRAITISLNDERDTGGQSKLARLLGWHHSTVWRKLKRSVADHAERRDGDPAGGFGATGKCLHDKELSAILG